MGWLSNIFGKQDNETDKLKNEEKKLQNILRQLETKGYVNCDNFVVSKELAAKIANETKQRKEKERLEKEAEENERVKEALKVAELIRPLVEPHVSKLFLKRSQLVKVDDYGNEDYSVFYDELAYFAENNVFGKCRLSIAQEDLVMLAISLLIDSYYEQNKTSFNVRTLEDLAPIDFEHGCADLLNQNGWVARVTQASGDQGIDVIATYGNVKAVFQVKKYSQPVGNSAVQEIIAGKAFEQAHVAAVVTNATYTASAKQLANATGVFLLHYSELPSFAEKLGLVETE